MIDKRAVKKVLGKLPFTAEMYWRFVQQGKPLAKNFSLRKLEKNLPDWCAQALAAQAGLQAGEPGRRILVFATLRLDRACRPVERRSHRVGAPPTTLTIAVFRAGYAVRYHPFSAEKRHGETKSKVRPLRDGLRFLLTLTRLAVLFVPLKVFLPVSLFMVLTGFGYVVSQLILRHRFSGFGGLVTTIGIFIFMLGLIAEQIALLRLVNSER